MLEAENISPFILRSFIAFVVRHWQISGLLLLYEEAPRTKEIKTWKKERVECCINMKLLTGNGMIS